jgi:hypothetical protein
MFWLVTMDEIVNIRSIFEFEIHNSVTDLFLNNNWLCFLYDGNGEVLKHPSVMYLGGHYNNIVFQAAFGLYKKSLWNKLGPFYVFTDYKNAVKNALETTPRNKDDLREKSEIYIGNTWKHTRGGIIRCILFCGTLKVFLNSKSDESSTITGIDKSKLLVANKEKKGDILHENRMNDQSGRWTRRYDMAMLGNPLLDNGNRFEGRTRAAMVNPDNSILYNYVEIDIETHKIMN